MLNYSGHYLTPGQLGSIETTEMELTAVCWGSVQNQVIGQQRLFDGAARDAGNTGNTDTLRAGLLLTTTAAGKFIQWGGVADLATDPITGILLTPLKMQRSGVNADRFFGYVLLAGMVKEKGVIVPGQTNPGFAGGGNDARIRLLTRYNFMFDDDPFRTLVVLP